MPAPDPDAATFYPTGLNPSLMKITPMSADAQRDIGTAHRDQRQWYPSPDETSPRDGWSKMPFWRIGKAPFAPAPNLPENRTKWSSSPSPEGSSDRFGTVSVMQGRIPQHSWEMQVSNHDLSSPKLKKLIHAGLPLGFGPACDAFHAKSKPFKSRIVLMCEDDRLTFLFNRERGIPDGHVG